MKTLPILFLLFVAGCANLGPTQNPRPAPLVSTPVASTTQLPPPGPRVQTTRTTGAVQRDVTYCTPQQVALKMDLYFPPQSEQPTPAAVFVHGGGWRQGDKTGGNLIPFDDLASQGFLVAAVNYRLAPEHKFPAMIQDVKCAVRYLRANAAKLNLDPNRIGAWGGSAGGHLVALLGTTDASAGFDVGEYLDQSSRVQAVVDMFGPTDLTLTFPGASANIIQSVFGNVSNFPESARLVSPVNYVTKDDPPFLILQGDEDRTVPPEQSQVLYDRLKGAGVPATLVLVKNAGHGFVPTGGATPAHAPNASAGASVSPTRDELVKMIREFFKKNLK